MRNNVLLTLSFCLVFVSLCSAETYDQYVPLTSQKAGQVARLDTGEVFSQWATKPTGTDKYEIGWGSPATWPDENTLEEFRVVRNGPLGLDWIWNDAFKDRKTGARYEVVTEWAEYYSPDGVWHVIIDEETVGKPFALYELPSGYIAIQVWGYIRKNDGTRGRDFYWHERLTHNVYKYNPVWAGPGSKNRICIKKQERWWDSVNGWTIGSGGLGSDGKPDGSWGSYGREGYTAKDIGLLWYYNNYSSNWEGGLKYQWIW